MNTCRGSNKLIPQTLFLGASVSNFNCNLGWSGQPSQLSVTLVNDNPAQCDPAFNTQFPSCDAKFNAPNQYYTCIDDDCYVDRDGSNWVSANVGGPRADGSTIYNEHKMLPGKIYYQFIDDLTLPPGHFVSSYFQKTDPGFLGNPNRVSINGTINDTIANSGYDLIGTPVYFKMGDFTFGGIVQSWDENFSSGGNQYRVVVEGMQSVLNNCYIITSEYAGSVFGNITPRTPNTNPYGGPKNYIGNKIAYSGYITDGNIPNVFNVYGFAESTAPENFGGSNSNDDGMSAKEILLALRILTSITDDTSNRLKDRANVTNDVFAPKTAFSPYGRILVKCLSNNYSLEPIHTTFKKLGVIPPQINKENGEAYCEFLLDLSEVPNPPDDLRIKGPALTITDFLNQITDSMGYDYTVDYIPMTSAVSNTIYNVIKIKTISRRQQPTSNEISNTIKDLYSKGYSISSSNIGKEKNESPGRCVIIGGKQQRLLQAKSYRLAYTQCNLIFDTRQRRFVDYIGLGKIQVGQGSLTRAAKYSGDYPNFTYGKIRFPSFLSTRNVVLNSIVSPAFSGVLSDEETLRQLVDNTQFITNDNIWTDREILGKLPQADDIQCGNYEKSKKADHAPQPNWSTKAKSSRTYLAPARTTQYKGYNRVDSERYFPLYKDIICPFFGYLMDNEYDIDSTKSISNRTFRRPRPVFFDTWTGQICVVFRASELPRTRVDLEGLYGGVSGFNRTSNAFTLKKIKRTGGTTATVATIATPSGPASFVVDSPAPNGTINFASSQSTREYFFIVTESEMRAALMGPDEYLIYSCAKTYKTDIYLMMNQAYIDFLTRKYTIRSGDVLTARKRAIEECDWHWSLLKPNIGGLVCQPAPVAPGKSSGAEKIPENVRKDFALIQNFIKGIAEQYYGRKYMVQAPYLGARKDSSFLELALPTTAGYAYVFGGSNTLQFNYEPTNAGAWEEYGNIIDDCIPIGGKDWINLSDDQGLIGPIVGYNCTDKFDRESYNQCLSSANSQPNPLLLTPNFQYDQWQQDRLNAEAICNPIDFVYPSLDISTLSDPTKYVVLQTRTPKQNFSWTPLSGNSLQSQTQFNTNIFNPASSGYYEPDSFGDDINFYRKKLYHTTKVEEKYVFLNPETLRDPRIIIDAPGISLNSTNVDFQKDPNNTVISNIAVEDAAVYLRSTDPSVWDMVFLDMLSSYVSKSGPNGLLHGAYSNLPKDSTTRNVMMKPKMAHPFFAGIPIKSNQLVYGPWTNYPYFDAKNDNIFPTGQIVSINYDTLATTTGYITYGDDQIKRAVNNWITPVSVIPMSDFVPWNYGGMSFLDDIALREVKSRVNYQPIIETATVEMAGLPLFNLGGSFNTQVFNTGLPVSGYYYDTFEVTEVKRTLDPFSAVENLFTLNQLNLANNLIYVSGTLSYNVISLPYVKDALKGPIISSIGVDIGQNGIKTTYMFRTYTRKLSLFNKEYSDKIKKFTKENLSRQKELSRLNQQIVNRVNNENLQLRQQAATGPLSNQEMTSKLVDWSPVEVIVASAGGFIAQPRRTIRHIEQYNSQTMPSGQDAGIADPAFELIESSDIGSEMFDDGFDDVVTQFPTLSQRGRIKTTAQIYQRTELGDFISKDYGTKSVMSLDGIFSPVSFYPTNNLSTFSFSKYNTPSCPVCTGSGKRTLFYQKFKAGTVPSSTGTYEAVCNVCYNSSYNLASKLDYSTLTRSSDGSILPPFITVSGSGLNNINKFTKKQQIKGVPGQNIPINLVSLQPLIVPYAEFSNPNIQHYTGAHPEGFHPLLQLGSNKNRNFIDRSRHSISIVGRSAVHQNSIEIHNNIDNSTFLLNYPYSRTPSSTAKNYHADFFHKDLALTQNVDVLSNMIKYFDNNQRFIGLRGPLVVHAWGYDQQGYPVPNAADEPLRVDEFNRPLRFKLMRTVATNNTKWKDLSVGDVFVIPTKESQDKEMIRAISLYRQNTLGHNTDIDLNTGVMTPITETTDVKLVTYTDDLASDGGFDPATYKGSIISKTQKYLNNTKWSPKQKLKEFYLNWGERPDTWPVGPVDLRWDETRKVWTADGGGNQYKMMYVTLEEDLTRHNDLDVTYPARGFFDDFEFSTQPTPSGVRRLVYVKDRCGYTAPRGAKLLCRYDADSGFYEPVGKPTYMVKGSLVAGTNQANIEMSYVQGKKKGENYPTMLVNFDNPFSLSTAGGLGLFTYINGKWTLTTSK